MIRLSILALILFYFSHVWASAASVCKQAAKTAYDKCHDTAQNTLDGMNLKAAQLGQMCADTPNVPACATDVSNLGGENNGKIDYAVNICDGNKEQCKTKCDPSLGKDANEKQFLTQQKNDCAKKIDTVKNQLAAGKPGNADAQSGGAKTASSSGSSPMAMPPISMPQSPSPTPTPTPDSQQATNTATPQSTPTPAAQPAAQTASQGKAGFSSAAVASTCGSSSNPSEIEGCQQYSAAAVAPAAATPFPSSSSTGGSAVGGASSGGGSSGGMNAAQVAAALAGQNKNGESEKDGKNSGLKAASINLGTDGGGGGGGSGAGGGSLPDFDFGMKPASAARHPASGGGSAESVSTVAGNTSVATQRFSVVKIVTEVYQDRCSKGRFLHCGTNK